MGERRRPRSLRILQCPAPDEWFSSTERGQFCAHCEYDVVDLSRLDEREAMALLEATNPAQPRRCVSVRVHRTGRALFRNGAGALSVSVLAACAAWSEGEIGDTIRSPAPDSMVAEVDTQTACDYDGPWPDMSRAGEPTITDQPVVPASDAEFGVRYEDLEPATRSSEEHIVGTARIVELVVDERIDMIRGAEVVVGGAMVSPPRARREARAETRRARAADRRERRNVGRE